MFEGSVAKVVGEPAPQLSLALTRLGPLGTLSRSTGEGGPSPKGWVGQGMAIERLQLARDSLHRFVACFTRARGNRYAFSDEERIVPTVFRQQWRQLVHQNLAGQGEKRRDAQ